MICYYDLGRVSSPLGSSAFSLVKHEAGPGLSLGSQLCGSQSVTLSHPVLINMQGSP